MEISEFYSVAGKSGLFTVVAKAKSGVILESIIDKQRFPAFSSQKLIALEDISIFTVDEDIPLQKVFRNIYEKESGNAALDAKSDGALLKKYFEEILPNYDKERVYVSDIKKVLSWYNFLQQNGLLKLAEEKPEESAKDAVSEVIDNPIVEEVAKTKVKKTTKKSAAKKTDEVVAKPKKTAAKKA